MNGRALLLTGILVVGAACSGAAATGPPSNTPRSTAVPTTIHATFIGAGAHPTITVEASSPWTLFKGFAITNDAGGAERGISFWDVGMVARNPCHPIGHLYDPGPTVDDLVDALEAQSIRHPTPPTDVTLAGYPGTYLKWSVPAGVKVTGDSDFAGCDVQSDGHKNFVSWDGAGGIGERWQQMAGQVDRLWILDVDGHRLVVDASSSPGTTQAQLDEEDQIVHSLAFVPAT